MEKKAEARCTVDGFAVVVVVVDAVVVVVAPVVNVGFSIRQCICQWQQQ